MRGCGCEGCGEGGGGESGGEGGGGKGSGGDGRGKRACSERAASALSCAAVYSCVHASPCIIVLVHVEEGVRHAGRASRTGISCAWRHGGPVIKCKHSKGH